MKKPRIDTDSYMFKPSLMDADFDKEPFFIDDKRWVIGVGVVITDLNFYPKKSIFQKIERDKHYPIDGDFTVYFCSKDFKDNPTPDYVKLRETLQAWDEYNSKQMKDWLEKKIAEIGEVSRQGLVEKLSKFMQVELFF